MLLKILNRTSFSNEFLGWLTIDRQSRSTLRLRMATGLYSFLSVIISPCMPSIHSSSCPSVSLSSRSRSFLMAADAKFTVLFSRAILLIPSLVRNRITRGQHFYFSGRFQRKFGLSWFGCPDLSSHLVSGILSQVSL